MNKSFLKELSRLYASWKKGQPCEVDNYMNIAELSGMHPEYFIKQFKKGDKPFERTKTE